MRRSEEGKATVVPVLFTDQKTEGTPFANVEPLRLAGDWSKVQELSQPMGSEIHLALVKLVQSRREDRAVEHKGQKRPAPTGLHFRVVWLWVAGLTGLLAIGILAWFSGDPAGHRILYKEPSPLTFFLKSCVIGFAAMSLLQIGRRLFPMRGSFHKELTVEWLGDAAVAELYTAVGAERIRNMFDLPSELLTGQLGAIADQVMEKQGRSEQPTLLIRRMAAEEENVVQPPAASSEQDPRVRAAMAIQRNLDQFQISTSALWRRYLLMTSILLSMTLFLFGLRLFDGGSFIPGLTSIPQHGPALTARQYSENFSLLCLATVLTALFGGFLGSIARDLVAIVEKLRR